MLVLITYDVNTEDSAGRRRLRQIGVTKPGSWNSSTSMRSFWWNTMKK